MSVEQVDFYLVTNRTHGAQYLFACRLTEKAYNLGLHIHIQTPDLAGTEYLDELLWTFNEGSFIPHQRKNSPEELCAVTVNHDWQPNNHGLLINLTPAIPDFHTQFARIAEIVGPLENEVAAGRQRYKVYKDKGLNPTHHTVS